MIVKSLLLLYSLTALSYLSCDKKIEDLGQNYRSDYGKYITTDFGVQINDTDNSLKAGERGPTLLQDFHFREKMTAFDHERIPERVVHARGSGAHGYFQSYGNFSNITMAKFLQDPSVKTPTFVRFSTVLGPKGSADTVRDARGFATKFYTDDGNFDLVGNNIPVFFIQDAIKFPDLIHAAKQEQDSGMPTASTAHDTTYDFIVDIPESMHMIMWIFSDRAIPRSYRFMQGFGVHSFFLVNSTHDATFVKFHWKPLQGIRSLAWDEAQKIAGKDPDFHRRDLWQAIERGDYPEYELGFQLVPLQNETAFDFDLLDATKLIPEELVPVIPIGKMVLNKNPDNFFSETEQVSFHTGHVVPGIDFTNDPLLQGRLFSYLDTQINRHRTPNFWQIPINRAIVPIHNNQRDGFMQMVIPKGRVAYSPNKLQDNFPRPAPTGEGTFYSVNTPVHGSIIRSRSKSFSDYYSQAQLFWNSMTDIEKQHIVDAARVEIGKVQTFDIRVGMIERLNQVDNELARRVAVGVAVKPPRNIPNPNKNQTSPALSQEKFPKTSIKTLRVGVMLAPGSNVTQTEFFLSDFAGRNVYFETISTSLGFVSKSKVLANQTYATTSSVLYDALIVPGGRDAVNILLDIPFNNQDAKTFINEAWQHAKPIAVIDEGKDLLDAVGINYKQNYTQNGLNQYKGVYILNSTVNGGYESLAEAFAGGLLHYRFWSRSHIDKKI